MPKYHEFLDRYPTLEALAGSAPDDVRRLWYPLGYNVRAAQPARHRARDGGPLRRAAARRRGRAPGHARHRPLHRGGDALLRLRARRVPIVDTNVRRVLGRVFLGPRRLARLRGQKAMWDLAGALVPRRRAYDYNQALMDFGATWCTARAPRCRPCPMKRFCATYRTTGEPMGALDGKVAIVAGRRHRHRPRHRGALRAGGRARGRLRPPPGAAARRSRARSRAPAGAALAIAGDAGVESDVAGLVAAARPSGAAWTSWSTRRRCACSSAARPRSRPPTSRRCCASTWSAPSC